MSRYSSRIWAGILAALILILSGVSEARLSPSPHASLLASDPVIWFWAGALTPNSVVVKARLNAPAARVRLAVSHTEELDNPLFSGTRIASVADHNLVALPLFGLTPATEYTYALEIDGELLAGRRGHFRTPAWGGHPFRFVVGGDMDGGDDASVFADMAALDPAFFLINGDLHYANIVSDDDARFRAAFDNALASPALDELLRQAPIAYIWDDHDYGSNNSHAGSPARRAARAAYREHVPHHPLPAGPGDAPIYQAFTFGRVRFILTDLRSERDSPFMFWNEDKSILGAVQKAWLKEELLAAKTNQALTIWVSSVPWIAPEGIFRDDWGGYTAERAEIADFIHDHTIDNLVMLAGDAHMLALDDGSNNRYAKNRNPMFPVFHAAPLHKRGSNKGGPYRFGPFVNASPEDGQFGLVEIEDIGGSEVCVEFSGLRSLRGGEPTEKLIDWRRCFETEATQTHLTTLSLQNGAATSDGRAYDGMRSAVLSEDAPDTIRGLTTTCHVDGDDPPGSGHDLATLLTWKLPTTPAGAEIAAASIDIYVTNPSDATVHLRPLSRAWQDDGATWKSTGAGDRWQSPGANGDADRDPTILGTLSTPSIGWQRLWLNAEGLNRVQQWLDDPASNHGFVLASAHDDTGASDGVAFICRSQAAPQLLPQLNLDFTTTEPYKSTLFAPLLNR